MVETVKKQSGVEWVDEGHFEETGEFREKVVGVRQGNAVANLNMGDLEYGDKAFFEHGAGAQHPDVDWIEYPTSQNTQAMALDFVVPNNLSAAEYEALNALGYEAGDRIIHSVADEATKNLCNATGRVYATEYIDGMFEFTDRTNILDAVGQYFPEDVDQALNIILNSEAYAGDAGVKFFTNSFSTSHGITSVMETMKGWGTGWGIEHINAEALEAARTTVDIIELIPEDPVWVENWVEKPIYKWVEQRTDIPNEAMIAVKKILTGVTNGINDIGVISAAHDVTRPTHTQPERDREKDQGESR